MKKIILSFILVICACISIELVKGDTVLINIKTEEVSNHNTLSIKQKSGENNYVLVLNDTLAVDINTNGRRLSFVELYETTNRYFIYGALQKGNSVIESLPFIYSITKDLNTTQERYYMDGITESEDYEYAFIYNLFEYDVDEIYYVMLEDPLYGVVYPFIYSGEYKLSSLDNEDINSIYLPVEFGALKLSNAYDLIEVRSGDTKYYYYTKELIEKETYKKEDTVYGSFRILSKSKVNGIDYVKGSNFTTPGLYHIVDENNHTYDIHLEPIIMGLENRTYDSYVDFQVTGGTVFINDEPGYLNGTISKCGQYKIRIEGIDGYKKELTFIIKPKLYSSISDGGTLELGDKIVFSGQAKLNETIISSGYTINEPGTYTLTLYLENETYETLTFSVNETLVSNKTKVGIYIALSSVLVASSGFVVFVIIKENKKKKSLNNK